MRHISMLAIIILVSFSSSWAQTTKPAEPDTPARRAYAKIQALAGTWEGQSTKGWTERLTIKPIAGGSCVMEESQFAHEADPQKNMLTVYHLDGEHLMLTHYCMAKNQPRLRATDFSEDGKKITFEFIDGTNLASRDVGHMDKVVIQFDSPDAYRSQWTFYAKGKEQWMEQITYKRVDDKK